MSLPNVKVNLEDNRLGRIAPNEDGFSGLIVTGVALTGKFALGDCLGPFKSTDDANDAGLDEQYDSDNALMVYKHIVDYFKHAPRGTELYVMPVASTVNLSDMVDVANEYAKKLINFAQGKIRLMGISSLAPIGLLAGQFEADLFTAIAKAQALADEEFGRYRPVSFILEGRNYQGNAAAARNLRASDDTAFDARSVSVVISQDPEWAATKTEYAKYAQVGLCLGKAAGSAVQRNIGRVKSGKLKLVKSALSDGTPIENVAYNKLEALNDKGYVFAYHYTGKDGLFFNDDHTAIKLTSDYAYLSRTRVIDKVARIARTIYLEELLDDLELDAATGKLAPGTVKYLQGQIELGVNAQMADEITSVSCFVDENQNVLATDTIDASIDIIPKGIGRQIRVALGFKNPFKNEA